MKIDNVLNSMGMMVYDVLGNTLIRLGPNLRTSEFLRTVRVHLD